MSAKRCSDCGVSYPNVNDYSICPQCLSPTDFSADTPVATDEAKRIKRMADFDREYEKRERGLASKCGEKRKLTPALRKKLDIRRDRTEELVEAARQINELERAYRTSPETTDQEESA